MKSVEKNLRTKNLVILPTLNEVKSLPIIVQKIRQSLPNLHILVVDNISTDGTRDKILELKKSTSKFDYIFRESNGGLSSAYKTGFEWGFENGFEYIAQMDADGQHKVSDLVRLFKMANFDSDLDLIIGSRRVKSGSVENWSFWRNALSICGEIWSKIMLGIQTRDNTSGFRVYKSKTLQNAHILEKLESTGFLFQIEMTMLAEDAGFLVFELPITFTNRQFDESKMSENIALEALKFTTKLGIRRKTAILKNFINEIKINIDTKEKNAR